MTARVVAERAVAGWCLRNKKSLFAKFKLEDKSVVFQTLSIGDRQLMPAPADAHRIEIKFKTHATVNRATMLLETGINRRLWDHYKQIQLVEKSTVVVLFCHTEEDAVVGGPVNVLGERTRLYLGSGMGAGGMVFFPYANLPTVAKLSEMSSVFRNAK